MFHGLTVGTALPYVCVQDVGYPGEIGYQTFLYSSVKEWRRLLMFLLEKLPKEKAQAGSESLGRWHHRGEGGGRRFGGSRWLALHTLVCLSCVEE